MTTTLVSFGLKRFTRSRHRCQGKPAGFLWRWRVVGLIFALGWFASLGGVKAADDVFNLQVDLQLGPAPAGGDERQVVGFTASQNTGGFAGASFENNEVLKSVVRKLNPPKLRLPVALDHLIAALQTLDNNDGRIWLGVSSFSPTDDFPRVLISYRYEKKPFVIDVHLQNEDVASTPATVVLPTTPEVSVLYRGTPLSTASSLAVAASNAGKTALGIALRQGLVVGGAPGDIDAIRRSLTETFLIPVPNKAQEYRASTSGGVAIGVVVNPVFVPKTISIELDGWKVYEAHQSAGIAARLKAKREVHEGEIREELASLLPSQQSLITATDVVTWQKSELGQKYGLSPLRYENENLVLSAADFASVDTYAFDIGASYDATDGVQGVGSARVLHDKRTHLELGVEVSAGAKAESETVNARWMPQKNIAGWSLIATATAGSHKNDESHFGTTAGGEGIEWRRWITDVGFTAQRNRGDPETGRWKSGVSAGLHLVHTDDRFDATAVPAAIQQPDSYAEAAGEWEVATLVGPSKHTLILDSRARFAQSTKDLGGNYDYDLSEAIVTGSLTAGGDRPRWKITTTIRGGRLRGAAPLGRQFRAGGNDGWIRGLQEGELIGSKYWAQSFAVGPDISSLLGGITEGKGPIFLQVFYDWGRVATDSHAWRTAQGYGVSVLLDKMPVGTVTAALSLGYAYSPESRVDRRGSFFVHLDFPFVH